MLTFGRSWKHAGVERRCLDRFDRKQSPRWPHIAWASTIWPIHHVDRIGSGLVSGHSKPRATICVRGRFTVRAEDGTDLTPPHRKERALLALLAMSPDGRRSRAWLQSKLWSEKPPEKASANLRRALTNLRTQLGENVDILAANRLEIWLDPGVSIDKRPGLVGKSELLELVDAPDPAFDEWLRDLRAADMITRTEVARPETVGTVSDNTIIVIRVTQRASCEQARFLEFLLIDTLSARLEAEGASEIYSDTEPDPDRLKSAAAVVHLELTSVSDAGWWNVHLRALADTERRFLWSGRLRLPLEVNRLAEGSDVQSFVSRALAQIFLRFRSFRRADRSPLFLMQRAAARLYGNDIEQIRLANRELETLHGGEGAAVSLAWRAFSRLAETLEFDGDRSTLAQEAEDLIADALEKQPTNPLVASLAARVALDLATDVDRADYLARAAMQSDEHNPYALQASSRVALMQGRAEAAYEAARNARKSADGMPHVFAWDMEICLTALGLGELDVAHSAVRAAHANNPRYRAALRYLVALSLLNGDLDGAAQATERLRRFEPDFEIGHLLKGDYPVLTLRKTGYTTALSEL